MGNQLLFFGLGLLGLYLGAEWLVRGAARLASSYGVSAMAVGLTVVAFGTSAPELVVSGLASARSQGDVAIGNVIGSNILNIALILGLAAFVYPIRVEKRLLVREVPIMLGAMLLAGLFALDGGYARIDGLLLIVAFFGYIGFVLRAARREPRVIRAQLEEFGEAVWPGKGSRGMSFVRVIAGIGGLGAGAYLLVGSAVFFARVIGVSELIIGLTVIAIGTSLPELATTTVAAFRHEADIAMGNVVGSNVFNTLAILGVASVIQPLRVAPAVLRFEYPVMLGVNILLVPLALTHARIGRLEGALLLTIYVAFTAVLLARVAHP